MTKILKKIGYGLAGLAIAASSYAFEYKGDKFVIDAKKIPSHAVYYGPIKDGGNYEISSIGFVSGREVRDVTPEYREIREEKVKEGTARHQILTTEGWRKAALSIEKFGRDNRFDNIFESEFLSSRVGEEAVISVPESYEGKTLQQIIGMNDYTSNVVRNNR